ncbi:MAG: sulfotransferase domain-containing protein [Cyanobacteria bacterium J06582_2]
MTLPNFLGIGAAKCGTTWMYRLLKQHPQIYMPERKETNFFSSDDNYERGFDWYESFFPDAQAATKYNAIGEFSPRYINSIKSAKRIAELKPVEKLIVMLRDPSKRAYSQYTHAVRNGYGKSFPDFLDERPDIIERSPYSQKLEPFLDLFAPEQLCYFIFEDAIKNVPKTQQKIADFLIIDLAKCPNQTGPAKANSSYVPKYKWLNSKVRDINQKLRRSKSMGWVTDLSETLQVRQLLQKYNSGAKVPPISPEVKLSLQDTFNSDVDRLEEIIGCGLEKRRCS